ncbi:hypothetical protein KNP414_05889 [Paenibacillus mucilaginosus KNP414]|uniref:Uncharacterized protein n=1 Tax=Paenibacillus mucilaginosus (strain KNP414) TaxID=1036673 RepID=F8F9T4_PAEMK|nr:hypothetical protein KNP414_05889 [Paenibacillus mucilaginosus KNP414]
MLAALLTASCRPLSFREQGFLAYAVPAARTKESLFAIISS